MLGKNYGQYFGILTIILRIIDQLCYFPSTCPFTQATCSSLGLAFPWDLYGTYLGGVCVVVVESVFY